MKRPLVAAEATAEGLDQLRIRDSWRAARDLARLQGAGYRGLCWGHYAVPFVAVAALAGQLVRSGRVSAVVGPRARAISAFTVILGMVSALAVLMCAAYFGALELAVLVLSVLLAVVLIPTVSGERRLSEACKGFVRRNGWGPFDSINLLSFPADVTDDELRAAAARLVEATDPTRKVAVVCRSDREAEVFLSLGVGLRPDVPGAPILVGEPVPQQ